MNVYRAYILDRDNHIRRAEIIPGCSDDATAIGKARTLSDGRAVELWHGPRKIALITSAGVVKTATDQCQEKGFGKSE